MVVQPLSKAALTRQAVVDCAYEIAAEAGLGSISIGGVAERLSLSKSGVFARVGSRDELILAVLEEASRRIAQAVVVPALRAPRGMARLRELFGSWVGWMTTQDRGCVMYSATVEYDDQPGPIRDAVLAQMAALRGNLARAVRMAIETGELAPGTDADQVVFELYGAVLMAHNDRRLFADEKAATRAMRAFERAVGHEN
jgi:AcrR family transcriptional regulator